MAMRRLSRTMMLITEKLPNMISPQNLVNSLIPFNSKLSKSISPNEAQNSVCVVSHKLGIKIIISKYLKITPTNSLGKLSVSKAVVDLYDYFIIHLIRHLG